MTVPGLRSITVNGREYGWRVGKVRKPDFTANLVIVDRATEKTWTQTVRLSRDDDGEDHRSIRPGDVRKVILELQG